MYVNLLCASLKNIEVRVILNKRTFKIEKMVRWEIGEGFEQQRSSIRESDSSCTSTPTEIRRDVTLKSQKWNKSSFPYND